MVHGVFPLVSKKNLVSPLRAVGGRAFGVFMA
jgi:hypothetical protein